MKAFILDRYGKKNNTRIGEVPEPTMRDDDVLVQIHAASVNPLDSKISTGEFKLLLKYKLPFVMGHDLAGVVLRVGSRVRNFKSGDEVYARPSDYRIGAFAQYISIKESDLALKPKTLTMEEAASLPLVALTAWQALVDRAKVKKGQKVLIHAGAGGVGTIAIQLAKHLGATVATTTSTANVALVKSLGADVIIDYKKEDFSTLLSGYDVALNSLDAKTLSKSARVLKSGGQLISISGPPDMAFAKELGSAFLGMVMHLLSRGIRKETAARGASYSFLFMKASGSQLREITSLVESGVIRPVVDRIFSFDETKEAIAYVETGRAKGKVVIKM